MPECRKEYKVRKHSRKQRTFFLAPVRVLTESQSFDCAISYDDTSIINMSSGLKHAIKIATPIRIPTMVKRPTSKDKRLKTLTGIVCLFTNNQTIKGTSNNTTKGTSNNKDHQKRAKKLDAAITAMVIKGSATSKSTKVFSNSGITLTMTNTKIQNTATAKNNVTKKQDG